MAMTVEFYTTVRLVLVVNTFCVNGGFANNPLPIVVNTWPFTNATARAWEVLQRGGSALDAVEEGCHVCEVEQCDHTVGYGGSPNEDGETTLDAMIMDGTTMDVGSVGCLKRIKSAIAVARRVMEHSKETLLVGDDATRFAVAMGFKEESLSTNTSVSQWKKWKDGNCQPNFWKDVVPDPTKSCGPYRPSSSVLLEGHDSNHNVDIHHHDTIGMIAISVDGHIVSGTSTNGATFKIPGRVGDSPISGSGSYADTDVGAAAQTGDGDVMMRFSPTYQTVESMRLGMSPTAAAEDAIRRIVRHYPTFGGGIVAVNRDGEYGAACHGFTLTYSVRNAALGKVEVFSVTPIVP